MRIRPDDMKSMGVENEETNQTDLIRKPEIQKIIRSGGKQGIVVVTAL